MKILVLAQSAGLGGVESSLKNFVNYIDGQGHSVTVVFWREDGPLMAQLPDDVRIIDVQTGIAAGVYRTGGLRQAIKSGDLLSKAMSIGFIAIRKALRFTRNPWILLKSIPEEFDIGIAYRHEGYAPYYLIDSVKAKRKYTWYHHGTYSPSPMGQAVDRRYFERMSAIVAVSESARSVVVNKFPSIEQRVRVIPNIIDEMEILLGAETPVLDATRSSELTLVTVSRLSAEKSVDIAVRAANSLKSRGLRFTWYLVGDGPDRSAIEELVDDLGVADCFILLGRKTNPYAYMQLADVYVQTSSIEAHPLTIQEAMVLRKPIVASNIPAVGSILLDGQLGVLSRLTGEDFADAIADLAVDDQMRAAFTQRLAEYQTKNSTALREIDHLLSQDEQNHPD